MNDKPTKLKDDLTLRDLQEAADRIVERQRERWVEEHMKLEAMIAEAIRTKSFLPDKYWEAEHRARGRYLAAVQLKDSLKC